MPNPENLTIINEKEETRKSGSYLTARSFIKDFGEPAPIVIVPYCSYFLITWNDVAVNLFVKDGNKAKEAEKSVWLKSWPMTSESFKKNMVDALREQGGGESYDDLMLVGPNTSAQSEKLLDILETIEKDSFMQQVMKTVLEAEPGVNELAHFKIFNEEQPVFLIGTCQLPLGFVHLFNNQRKYCDAYKKFFHYGLLNSCLNKHDSMSNFYQFRGSLMEQSAEADVIMNRFDQTEIEVDGSVMKLIP